MLELLRRGFFRSRLGNFFCNRLSCRLRGCRFLFRGHFSLDLYGHARGHFPVQPDGHLEVAQALDRVAQLNLAAIDLEALRRQRCGNIGRCDRAK